MVEILGGGVMRKRLQKIQYLEQQIINTELCKIDNAEMYYRKCSFFNMMSILFFVMGIIMIITAAIYQSLLININDMLIGLFILLFVFVSLISLIISTFYNFKTIKVAEKYYNN